METIVAPETGTGNAAREEQRVFSLPIETAMLYACAAFVAFFNIHLALTRTINWDEFHFFGQIVEFNRGETLPVLQTLHVEVFQWLPEAVSNGTDGIIIARLFMLVCEFITALSIAAIAGRFAKREYAITAALLWLASGFTLHHGWSFRTDPIATAFAMTSLAVLARAPLSVLWMVLSGALIGVAGAVTIKAILYLPAFAGLAILRWSEARYSIASAIRIAAIPVLALGVLAALVVWHAGNLPETQAASAGAYVGGTSQSMLFAGWPIYLHFLPRWVILSIPAFLILVVAVPQIKKRPFMEAIAIACLFAPVAALLIYRNSLPYFYPTMLAPVMAASVIGVAAFAQRFGLDRLLFYIIISAMVVWAFDKPSRMDAQRDIQVAADTIFAEPVGYFDFPGMLPNHRKANSFLTRWGIESDYKQGPGKYRAILERETVPLLLTAEPEQNPTLLAIVNEWPQQQRFHQEDRELLRATYRPFWGPFWLAGTQLEGGETQVYEVLVPGPYTVTDAPITINDDAHAMGSVIEFERGTITLHNSGGVAAGIVWGDNPRAPDRNPPERPYWRGF